MAAALIILCIQMLGLTLHRLMPLLDFSCRVRSNGFHVEKQEWFLESSDACPLGRLRSQGLVLWEKDYDWLQRVHGSTL